MNRSFLSLRTLGLTAIGLVALLSGACLAQGQPATNQPAAGEPPVRTIRGQTLSSPGLPAAEFTFSKDFRYVGGQVINLYGNADAEQHLFVKGPANGPVEAFYWLQFEHFLPSNQYQYDYKPERVTLIGGVPFIYDVKSFSDYEGAANSTPLPIAQACRRFSRATILRSRKTPRAYACSICPRLTNAPS